ncbi:hypothetical protein [Clostridium butyricum]|nr:hypothetical protein [Clostridium butyricum]MCQ2017266.1 hypothetical protein [Clostridium butyricum]MCQ2021139.1 hypothetical protein [Clostridium butyricum]UTY53594.1 hypothetical protein HNS01_11005 [Clostridium butyricum]
MHWSVKYIINAAMEKAIVKCNEKAYKNIRHKKYLKRVRNRNRLKIK